MILPALAAAWFIALTAVGAWDAPWWLAGLWVALVSPLAWWQSRGAGLVATACIAVALAGGWHFGAWEGRDPPTLGAYVGRDITVLGTIDSEPSPGRVTVQYTVRAAVLIDGASERPIDGRLRVTLSQYAAYLPGDPIVVTGELEEPPVLDGFDYRAYLARQDIVGTMFYPTIEPADGPEAEASLGRLSVRSRLALEEALRRALPEPEASIGAGIVFGLDGNIPQALEDDFRDSGLAHILAVSGSNITIVAGLTFIVATRWFHRRWGILLAAAAIAGYLLVGGFGASTIRAGIMATIYLVSLSMGRQQSGMAALGLAGVVMTAWRPAYALDAGFQLSFAATAGLIAFAPWIRAALDAGRARMPLGGVVPSLAIQVTAISLAATIATLPIMWATFGRLSLVGPLANVVIDPLFAVAFWASLLTALAGLVWEPAGWLLGLGAYYPVALIRVVAERAADVPFAAVDLPEPSEAAIAVSYAAMAAVAFAAYRRYAPHVAVPETTRREALVQGAAIVAAGGAMGAWITSASLLPLRAPGELVVSVLDVGQGDALLVRTPGGHTTLIDGGPSAIDLARQVSAVLPHWERTIDTIIVTHPQEDHIGGLPEALDRYTAGQVLWNGAKNETIAFGLLAERAPLPTVIRRGDTWEVDDVRFEVLWPSEASAGGDLNNGSVVLRLTYGETVLLLTGDIEAEAQHDLLEADVMSADILKVPHHGGDTNADGFLDAVGAEVAIISAGAGNRFGHPDPAILAALDKTLVFRTDVHGRIRIASDGDRIRVTTAR